MFSSLLQRCWAENGKDCGGHEGYWNHSKIQWENRKPWSTKWIKYSYLNALALSGPEWPRWKQLNFFSFRCRLVREESLHFHNAQNSFSFRARWILAICTCWACTLKLCQSFPSLDPEISEKYPDPTRWWASAMLQLDGALWSFYVHSWPKMFHLIDSFRTFHIPSCDFWCLLWMVQNLS